MNDAYAFAADTRINMAMRLHKEENNSMSLFSALMGCGFWRLERIPGAGHDYYALLEAVYRYHRKYPEDRIDEFYEETLRKCARVMCGEALITEFLSIVLAEMDYEKNKTSPFRVDMQKILDIFGERLRSDAFFAEAHDIHATVARYDARLSEKHGLRISR